MKQLKTTAYTDPITGETFSGQQWVDMQFDDDGYLFWTKKAAVKMFIDIPLPDCFTWAEKGRLTELQHYMLKDHQLLVYRSHDGIRPLDIECMCRILGMSERRCHALVSKAKQEHVLKEIKIDSLIYFAYNPVYGFKGKRMSVMVYIMFQDELRKYLKPWVTERFEEQAQELRPSIKLI